MLKQPQFQPRAIWQMYVSLLSALAGCFDEIPVAKVNLAIENLFREVESNHQPIIKEVNGGVEASEASQKKILELANKIATSYAVHKVIEEAEK
jgi:F0F1-type ATP synthase alpha subunit